MQSDNLETFHSENDSKFNTFLGNLDLYLYSIFGERDVISLNMIWECPSCGKKIYGPILYETLKSKICHQFHTGDTHLIYDHRCIPNEILYEYILHLTPEKINEIAQEEKNIRRLKKIECVHNIIENLRID
jgi:hypothetical protein